MAVSPLQNKAVAEAYKVDFLKAKEDRLAKAIQEVIKTCLDSDNFVVKPYSQLLAERFAIMCLAGGVCYILGRYKAQVQDLLGFEKPKESAEPESECSKVRLDDIVGNEEAKEAVRAIIKAIKDPERIKALGLSVPKGVLFSGPPGTGKTFLAHAMASEAELPFFKRVASEFDQEFVGVGAKRVRELFDQAAKAAKASKHGYAIVFIDEFDLFADRSGREGERYKQTTNQLLASLENNPNVIVVAATNHKDSIDAALIRSGRFDRTVEFQMPESSERLTILQKYSSKLPLSKGVDLNSIADKTQGLPPASLKNIVNQAALLAYIREFTQVSQDLFEEATDLELKKVKESKTKSSRQAGESAQLIQKLVKLLNGGPSRSADL